MCVVSIAVLAVSALIALMMAPQQLYPIDSQAAQDDVLFYSVFQYQEGTSLFRFEVDTRRSTQILHVDERLFFAPAQDGRIAVNTSMGIVILDPSDNYHTGFNLSEAFSISGYALSWSPDSRYLVFVTHQDEETLLLYVWDGESIFDITPDTEAWTPEQYYVDWSNDGRLAVNVFFSFVSPNDEGPSEIYLWDGNTTMNLSQNLEGEDRFPVWNNQNELAFLAVTGERNGLYVWDGVSYRDGAPDAASYHQIAPGMTAYYSSPTWTTDGSIAFGVQLPADQRSQIYRWDGESLVNISQNPDAHNGGETWSNFGYWAFVTYFSPEQLIFIRDPDNNTLLETEGQYTPAWSSGNDLAFCRMERSASNLDWILSIWNETTLTEIARGDEIYAQWQSGQQTVCSSG